MKTLGLGRDAVPEAGPGGMAPGAGHAVARRLALAGAVGLLAGCQSVTDLADSVFGETERPLPGERRAVFATDAPVGGAEAGAAPISLPPAAPREDWAQAGGTPTHAPGHAELGAPLGEAWRASVGVGSAFRRRIVGPPVVAGGVVFAADAAGGIGAFALADGARRWRIRTNPPREGDAVLGAGLGVADGVLYAATGFAELLAIDPASGEIRWRVALPAAARGAPTIAGGRVLVPTIDNALIALSIEDGRRLWTYRAQATATLALGLPAPAVEGEVVVAGFGSGEVAAIRAGDGRLLWSETLSAARGGGLSDIAAIAALPVIAGGRVLATGLGGLTIAADLRSGRRIWEREIAAAATPAVAGNALFLVTEGGDAVCLGRDDGRVRWLTPLGRFADPRRRRDPITWGPPILAGGRLLVAGSNAQLVQIDPGNGEVILRSRLAGATILGPAIAAGRWIGLTEDATLTVLTGRG